MKKEAIFAWVAAFASQMINEGLLFGSDLLPPYLIAYFKCTKGQIMLFTSVLQAPQFLFGPVSSFLTNRCGSRTTLIVCSVIAGISLFLASYCTRFWQLLLAGAVTGLCFGLSSVPRVTSVSFHFPKEHRNFATSLAMVGGSLGAAVFPFIFQYFLSTESWQTTFVYISFIIMQTAVLGAFLGQPSHHLNMIRSRTISKIFDKGDNLHKEKDNELLLTPVTIRDEIPAIELEEPSPSSPPTPTEMTIHMLAPLALEEDLGSSRSSTGRRGSISIVEDLKHFLEQGDYPTTTGTRNSVFIYNEESHSTSVKLKRKDDPNQHSHPPLTIFLVSTFLWCIGEWADCIFPLWLTSENFSSLKIAILVTITTSCGVLGRLLARDHKHFGFQGLLFGAAVGFHAPIVLEIVGLERFNFGLGACNFAIGFAGCISPPMSGFAADLLQSYRVIYRIAAVTLLISCVLLVPYHTHLQMCNRKQNQKTSDMI